MTDTRTTPRPQAPLSIVVDRATADMMWPAFAVEQHAQSASGLAERGAVASGALPPPVVRALHRYAAEGSATNTLLLRGLLPALPGLPPTPDNLLSPPSDVVVESCALLLLAVMTRLGAPFTFATLHEGRLVQHVAPVPGQEHAQTSGGSEVQLDWHVEDAFSADRCDYVGLLCLRGAADATTLSSTVRASDLDPAAVELLRQPRFGVVPDLAHGDDSDPAPVAVLESPGDDVELCVDAIYLRPLDAADRAAASALAHLHERLGQLSVGHVLVAGDLLVVDNRRAVHARTPFRPRYDGHDRWLLRVMACADGRRHRRRHGSRAV